MQVCDLRRIGKDQSHLRLKVRGESPYAVECVAWGAAERAESLRVGDRLDVLYSPQSHIFNGRHNLQLDIKDMRLAGDRS
jgi:hypothetical protein